MVTETRAFVIPRDHRSTFRSIFIPSEVIHKLRRLKVRDIKFPWGFYVLMLALLGFIIRIMRLFTEMKVEPF